MSKFKTPTKENIYSKENYGYSPLILRQSPAAGSPQKNLAGPPRVVRDIVADLFNNIQHWNDSHIKGANIVKQIGVLIGDNPKEYSPQLEEYTNELFNIVNILETFQKRFEQFNAQIRAFSKLSKNCDPIFISLDANLLANIVVAIADAYIQEFKLKQLVLENISHSRDKHEVMFYASCWTHQIHITSNINLKLETLLMETGFRSCS